MYSVVDQTHFLYRFEIIFYVILLDVINFSEFELFKGFYEQVKKKKKNRVHKNIRI